MCLCLETGLVSRLFPLSSFWISKLTTKKKKMENWTVGRPGNKFGYWLIDCSCFYQPYRQHQPDCFTCMRQSSLFPSHPSTTEVAWYWINTSHHSFFAYHKLDGGKSWEHARLITMNFSNSIGSLLPPSANQ